MISPLNRTNAPMIVRFFDICFKQGVLDACDLGDDYGVREFIEEHRNSFTFGILGQPDDYDWQMFRFTLYRWARSAKMTGLAENYIYEIRKKNYLWCFLLYCLRFYILGMEEWLKYPNQVAIQMFKKERKIHWDPSIEPKKFSVFDVISYMHEFAADYRRIPEDERPVGSFTMDDYCSAIYDLTRKYVTGKTRKKKDV